MGKSSIIYSLDRVDLAAGFGIHISASRGVLDLPSLKQPQVYDWVDYHGVIVDLEKPRYNTRTIILDAWIETKSGMIDFAQELNNFYAAVRKPGLHQLNVFISPDKPLVFMVYMKDEINVVSSYL